MLTRLVSVPVLLLLLAADQPAGTPAKDSPTKLDGKWKLVALEIKGENLDLAGSQPKWVIEGNKVLYGGQELARLTLDAAAKPKIMDLAFLDPKKVYEGIYAIDQDTLKVCFNIQTEGIKERPQEFATKDKEGWRLLVFKRQQAEEDPAEGIRGYIGVALRFEQEKKDVIVAEAIDGGPAQKAGLQKDNVILTLAGSTPKDLMSTVETVRQLAPGSQLALRIRRDGKERDIQIKVAMLPFKWLALLD